jgi:hypothetical protein
MRLYIANVVLTQQLKELLSEKHEIMMKLLKFEVPHIMDNLAIRNKQKTALK